MLSKFFINLSIILIAFSAKAQTFSVAFSEKIKSQSGILQGGFFQKSLPAGNDGILALFLKERKKGFLSGDRRAESYQLVKFDKNLEIVKELEIDEIRLKDAAFIDFLRIGGRYYFFTQQYNKEQKSITIEAIELLPSTLAMSKPVSIVSWDVSDDRSSRRFFSRASADEFGIDLLLSADSTTFGFSYFPDVKRKETVNTKYIVLDRNLKKLASNEFDFGVSEKKMEMNEMLIDNRGKVYFNYDIYDDKDSKSFKRVNGEKVPAYSSHLLIMDGNNKTDIVLDNENHFIKKLILGEDISNNVSVFAFYKNFYRGEYAGVARASLAELQSSKSSVPFKFMEFPQELLDLIDHDRFGDNSGDDKGISTEFEFRTVIAHSDNSFQVIMEYDKLRVTTSTSTTMGSTQTSTTYRRTYGDMVVATITKDNKATFTRIPKLQQVTYSSREAHFMSMGGRKLFFYSYQTAFYKDKLLIFYNDDEDNITRDLSKRPDDMVRVKQSALACATINRKGELEKREAVFSHREMDGYMTSSTFYEVAPNTYGLFALKAGIFKYGTKIGKLTIK